MRTTSSPGSQVLPMDATRMAVPPPRRLDLLDAETTGGWIDDLAIGFRGFANEAEAVYAASVAYRTMERRLSRDGDTHPLPGDTEPIVLRRSGDVELIMAGGRPIATLVRPGADSPSGPDSFGFSLPLPVPSDELTRRSTAYLVYRELRRLGIQGTAWASPSPANGTASEDRASEKESVKGALPRPVTRQGTDAHMASGRRRATSDILGTSVVIAALLAAIVLPAIMVSSAIYVLVAAVIVALASIGGRVAMTGRDALRGRLATEGTIGRAT